MHPQHLTACGTYSPCRTSTPTGWRAFFNPDSRRPSGCQRSVQRRKNRFSTSKTSAASRPALGDARGEAPCIRKQKISPFPPGRGQGDRGQEGKLKARLAGSKQGKPPAGRVVRPHFPVPPGFSPRGCKGRSPLHKKTKNLPLPRRGRGLGGWGQESKLKARLAGSKQGKPPAGRVVRPHFPVPRGFSRGDARGEAPCIRKQKISPFPGGEGSWGMGAKKKTKGRVGKRQRRQAAPQGTTGAGRAVRKKANA